MTDPIKSPELLPCPFCGGVAEINHIFTDKIKPNNRYSVICWEGCMVSSSSCGHDTLVEAIAAWNTRTEAPHLLAIIKRQREALEWQPIESAPRDGTLIILHRTPQKLGTSRKTDIIMGRHNGNCWITVNCHYQSDECFTHWQPLPAPPTSEGV